MTAYVNIHGQPLSTSARDAVLAIEPDAICEPDTLLRADGEEFWIVRKSPRRYAKLIGGGSNEEAAWRDAWSRMLAEDLEREGKAK